MVRLHIVFGDQLDHRSALWDDFGPDDRVWMAEVPEEIGRSHAKRIVFFLSAMRHFSAELEARGFDVDHHRLANRPSKREPQSFWERLDATCRKRRPESVRVVLPGDHRVLEGLRRFCHERDLPLQVLPDRHFFVSPEWFARWAKGRKELVLEHFYRKLRKDFDVLMTGGRPEGGSYNFDSDNRESFSKSGPPSFRKLPSMEPDETTAEVMELVRSRFRDNPGRVEGFSMPVDRAGALHWLRFFIEHQLPDFGRFQDAMAAKDAVLLHSRLSAPMNLKLLAPAEAVEAAVGAYRQGKAPINSVEGYVRQLLGWREFVRGIYWTSMPEYGRRNALGCEDRDVPEFFWTADTDMACVHDSIRSLLDLGYLHHIHRLMVLGLFAQLAGVHPRRFHDWHMDMYVDAVDWVSLPNALGMSQYGDGGIVGTKPYVATGKYIQRMSPYCRGCRYDPARASGDDACPFTTLYWDFLARHGERFRSNRRMALQVKNVDRKDPKELDGIRKRARALKGKMTRKERF
jgi:deoxyribodipyrimidine photolyase-related protein